MAESAVPEVEIVGAGLAGSEAAFQLAARGVPARLYEMRPSHMTPAHHTGALAELVCSNSMRSERLASAPGLLKAELRLLGSMILRSAEKTRLPAGTALAVDRESFSKTVTQEIQSMHSLELVREERKAVPPGPAILATGPLTSEDLEASLAEVVGIDYLYFYDAAAPLVETESIDMSKVFSASRYAHGGDDYLNCPMDEVEYARFHEALLGAERVVARRFENKELFSACQPVEEIALRGMDALRFGPMKPVGLTDPRSGKRPHAVVQLRRDNAEGTVYNMVGFQTNLKWGEQDRVFRLIPGLENADFARYGVMHRNTFVESPKALDRTLALKNRPGVRLAGQLTGGEGYMEAAATGLVAALNTYAELRRLEHVVLPKTTAIGSLVAYVTGDVEGEFQPQHANLGLLPPLEPRVKNKQARHEALAKRALEDMRAYVAARTELHVEAVDGVA